MSYQPITYSNTPLFSVARYHTIPIFSVTASTNFALAWQHFLLQ